MSSFLDKLKNSDFAKRLSENTANLWIPALLASVGVGGVSSYIESGKKVEGETPAERRRRLIKAFALPSVLTGLASAGLIVGKSILNADLSKADGVRVIPGSWWGKSIGGVMTASGAVAGAKAGKYHEGKLLVDALKKDRTLISVPGANTSTLQRPYGIEADRLYKQLYNIYEKDTNNPVSFTEFKASNPFRTKDGTIDFNIDPKVSQSQHIDELLAAQNRSRSGWGWKALRDRDFSALKGPNSRKMVMLKGRGLGALVGAAIGAASVAASTLTSSTINTLSD